MNKVMLSLFFLVSIMFSSLVCAKPADFHAAWVNVINTCATAVTYNIQSTLGSVYTGSHQLPAYGSKNVNGAVTYEERFMFGSMDDEEFYTVSYNLATCKIDYPMMRDRSLIDV